MTLIWVVAFLGLLLVEFLTVGLVSIWFAVGALAALITSFITESVLIQTVIFIVVSVITLIVTQPLIKKFKVNRFEPTNSDRVIGKVAEVTKEIRPDKYGEVEVYGVTWMAAGKSRYTVGSKVIVKQIEGSKLIVEKEGE